MVVNVPIDDDVFSGLKRLAEPLVDDVNSVLRRLIAAYESAGGGQAGAAQKSTGGSSSSGIVEFDAASPPDLLHTTPTKITLAGRLFKPTETYWNTLLIEVIREAAKKVPKADLTKLIIVNHAPGERNDTGFRYIPEAGVSVQGQDSDRSWSAIHHIAAQTGLPVEVEFRWQPNPKAAYPNGRGRFRVNVM